jgi:hypothetical protein
MGHRLRDMWLEIEVRRLASFPYVRLSLRPVWDDADRAEESSRPRFATNRPQVSDSRPRRAA